MTKWTKADIDGLVEGMEPSRVWPGAVKLDAKEGGWIREKQALKQEMYLAAGLTAKGEPKPEKVRCWLFPDYYPDGRPMIMAEHKGCAGAIPFIPGVFVPDGAA